MFLFKYNAFFRDRKNIADKIAEVEHFVDLTYTLIIFNNQPRTISVKLFSKGRYKKQAVLLGIDDA